MLRKCRGDSNPEPSGLESYNRIITAHHFTAFFGMNIGSSNFL
jgi:hypothetical protein